MTRIHRHIALGMLGLAPLAASELDIHGFISQGYVHTTENHYLGRNTTKGSFEQNEAAINFGSYIDDDIRIGMQLFARDLGHLGNNQVTVDWAYADWSRFQNFGLRLGRIKTPSGLYNEVWDIDAVRTPALLPATVYFPNFRDLFLAYNGGQIYGNIPIDAAGDLDYQIYAGAVSIDGDSSIANYFQEDLELLDSWEGSSSDKTYGALLAWNTPLDGLKLVTSINVIEEWTISGTASFGSPFPFPITYVFPEYVTTTLSAEYQWQDLLLAAEYRRWESDIETTAPNPANPAETVTDRRRLDTEGWYLHAGYRFSERLAAATYYGEYYGDRNDRDRTYQKDLALSLRFDANDFWAIKAEYHSMNGTAFATGPTNENPKANWEVFFVKTTLTF